MYNQTGKISTDFLRILDETSDISLSDNNRVTELPSSVKLQETNRPTITRTSSGVLSAVYHINPQHNSTNDDEDIPFEDRKKFYENAFGKRIL